MITSDHRERPAPPQGPPPQRRSIRLLCILCGLLASILLALVMASVPAGVAQAQGRVSIKFATLAPDGSSWMRQMRLLEKEIEKQTQGAVRFKFYPGGVSGDEKDVIRKMRIGQIHAAGFTGVGLGEILPEVRVLDLPFLFENDREISYVYEKMTGYFAEAFEKKGFILLGWVPVGWVHFFSKAEVKTLEDLQRTKAWMWEGDPLVQTAYQVLGISPHPLSITDVLMGLQTGMLETVYASPLGALALQWFTKVNYMSRIRMGNATGGVLMSRRKFDRLSPEYQTKIREYSKKYLSVLVQKIQEDNDKAIKLMMQNGLKLSPEPAPAEIERFHRLGSEIRNRLTGKLFSKTVLNKVLGYLQEVR
ncbi:MAG: TRAP transporter substrate-binding protein DctP [Nitrospinaceae bacterium]